MSHEPVNSSSAEDPVGGAPAMPRYSELWQAIPLQILDPEADVSSILRPGGVCASGHDAPTLVLNKDASSTGRKSSPASSDRDPKSILSVRTDAGAIEAPQLGSPGGEGSPQTVGQS